MTDSVRPTSQRDQDWHDLAAQLTPAASLARIDTVTARAVTTITVIGVLLTGLGAVSGDRLVAGSVARDLAIAAVIAATLAVATALGAQVLTITRPNPENILDVQEWYRRQFRGRARVTQVATIMIILAALLAGAAATASLADSPPAHHVTRGQH